MDLPLGDHVLVENAHQLFGRHAPFARHARAAEGLCLGQDGLFPHETPGEVVLELHQLVDLVFGQIVHAVHRVRIPSLRSFSFSGIT